MEFSGDCINVVFFLLFFFNVVSVELFDCCLSGTFSPPPAGHRCPPARSGHRCVADSSNLYVFGGYNPDYDESGGPENEDYPLFRELWRYNFATDTWHQMGTEGYMPRELASMSRTYGNPSPPLPAPAAIFNPGYLKTWRAGSRFSKRLSLVWDFSFSFCSAEVKGKKKKKKRGSRRCFPGAAGRCFVQTSQKHPKIAAFVQCSKQTFGYHGFSWDPFSFRASQSCQCTGWDCREFQQH